MSPAAEFAYRVSAAARSRASWLQLLKFSIVGGSGYLVNLVVFAALADKLGVHHAIAAVGAFCVAVTNNFLWNRYWTFGPGEGKASFQAARFLTVSVLSLALNLAVLEAILAGTSIGELSAQAIAVAAVMPFNFLGNKLWTFADGA
ncbi:MAG TPA: GtrA family protein [Solirubrobacterales bacterium]|nr:GtrA family protein [Solirubrobacterales bacterium]